ncbi:MAG TPA: glycine cleavage T C-terminal barrel domain-containing protein [Lacipirellulaceae bacterium]|nr:glycine cleavage T C-terminal barrel domain-containing protein [Lacipirellulaceae bacterium]
MIANHVASFDREYLALQSGQAIVEFEGWSNITVTGADRHAFLHNFCTNDVKRLAPGASCEAFFTNVKGKIVAHGWILCREEELIFWGAPGQGQELVEHLDRYVIRDDVSLHDTTGKRSFLLVVGETRPKESSEFVPNKLPCRGDIRLHELTVSKTSSVAQNYVDRGFVVAGPTAVLAGRVEAGLPLFGTDFDGSNLPQEIGRDKEALSFTKGCYLGQETVARIDALGHVNQKIVGIRFSDTKIPKPGTEVALGDAKVGKVTSVAFSPKLRAPLALAMLRREAIEVGTKLHSPAGECEIVELPLAADMED